MTLLIHIRREAVPDGMRLQRNRSVGLTVPMGGGASDGPAATPAEVARYADVGRMRTSRMVSVNRVDSDDPDTALQAMAAEGGWQPWPTSHHGSVGTSSDGVVQVAWATAGIVIWVIITGLTAADARRLIDGIDVDR